MIFLFSPSSDSYHNWRKARPSLSIAWQWFASNMLIALMAPSTMLIAPGTSMMYMVSYHSHVANIVCAREGRRVASSRLAALKKPKLMLEVSAVTNAGNDSSNHTGP